MFYGGLMGQKEFAAHRSSDVGGFTFGPDSVLFPDSINVSLFLPILSSLLWQVTRAA